MKFNLVTVGRQRSDPSAVLVAEYIKRARKFIPIEERVLRAEKEDALAVRILKEAEKSQILVGLDEKGVEYDSHQFAALVSSWMNAGFSGVTLVIGAAEGLPAPVRRKADLLVALSRLTFPHRLARLILAEQIYRAMCIIRGVPYQK